MIPAVLLAVSLLTVSAPAHADSVGAPESGTLPSSVERAVPMFRSEPLELTGAPARAVFRQQIVLSHRSSRPGWLLPAVGAVAGGVRFFTAHNRGSGDYTVSPVGWTLAGFGLGALVGGAAELLLDLVHP